MLKNENILCISSIDWDFIWQGHQEIMATLARSGNRVLFIENTGVRAPRFKDFPRIRNRIKNWFKGTKGIRQEMENLYVFSPLVLPFPYSRIARWINRHIILNVLDKWMKSMDFSNVIVWTFLATPSSLDLSNNLIKKNTIYYCIDNLSESSEAAQKIKKSEIQLLKSSNLVFVTSKALYDYCSTYSNNVTIFPFAVNYKQFEKVRLEEDLFIEEFRSLERPIIGYVGGIHKWIDQNLIKDMAEKNLHYSFVFIGPIQTDISTLLKLDNVQFLGSKDHRKLPDYIKAFDACIIPYRITEYTKNVYPTKLNEYLAMGKPVISSDLPELQGFKKEYGDVVYIGKDSEEFGRLINHAIEENNEELSKRRIKAAEDNSWESRIERMCELIEESIERKKSATETRWRDNLTSLYKLNRRRLLRTILFCVLIFWIIFYTPLIWFLATPLKITDNPTKADAIVVFAGGVGETGSPGKSTIERARYSVDLFNNGYSDTIIYSSGYRYKHTDASNMKQFALSLGILEENIILEQNANSAYENVKYTTDILRKKGYDKILLISSSYNMRRASLVYKNIANDIEVVYTPVPDSEFFKKKRRVRLEQIQAILHEYLAIVYYWIKGKI